MKINFETLTVVDREEYERLCRLDGAVDAVQRFVDSHGAIEVDDILDLLFINKTKRNMNIKKEKEERDAYFAKLEEKLEEEERKECTSES